MESYTIFEIEAHSFEGRIPLKHKFIMPAKNEDDALAAVQNRWPELYDIKINIAEGN